MINVITSKGGWWLNFVILDEISIDLSTIDRSSESFVIEAQDFIIEKKSKKEIHIFMSSNETGIDRVLRIGIQSGNYFDGIIVKQSTN